jgi:hypothetical protein
MKTAILPGYSPHNKEWAYEVKDNLKLGHKIIVHEWEHWPLSGSGSSNGQGSFSVKREIAKIMKEVGNEKVNFIVKSVGTRVLMHIAPLLQKQIVKAVLCGIPTKGTSESVYKIYKQGLSVLKPDHLIVFQNVKDPFASYSDIKILVGSINEEFQIVKKPRSDHHYPYYEDFQKFLSS